MARDDDECHLYPSCRWALAHHLVIGDECLFIVGVKHALDAPCLRRTHNKLNVEINQGLNEKNAIEAVITVDTVDPDSHRRLWEAKRREQSLFSGNTKGSVPAKSVRVWTPAVVVEHDLHAGMLRPTPRVVVVRIAHEHV